MRRRSSSGTARSSRRSSGRGHQRGSATVCTTLRTCSTSVAASALERTGCTAWHGSAGASCSTRRGSVRLAVSPSGPSCHPSTPARTSRRSSASLRAGAGQASSRPAHTTWSSPPPSLTAAWTRRTSLPSRRDRTTRRLQWRRRTTRTPRRRNASSSSATGTDCPPRRFGPDGSTGLTSGRNARARRSRPARPRSSGRGPRSGGAGPLRRRAARTTARTCCGSASRMAMAAGATATAATEVAADRTSRRSTGTSGFAHSRNATWSSSTRKSAATGGRAPSSGSTILGARTAERVTIVPDVGRIAVLRGNALGDLVVALPALDALREAYPSAEITLFGRAHHKALLGDGRPSSVDRVVVLPQGAIGDESDADPRLDRAALLASFAADGYDLAIQLHGGGRNSNTFIRGLGARVTAGSRTPDAPALDRWVPYERYQWEVGRYLEIVALVGARARELEPHLTVTAEDRCVALEALPVLAEAAYVVLHAGATDPRRRWPVEGFAQVARASRALGRRVVITGTPEESELTAAVAAAAGDVACPA